MLSTIGHNLKQTLIALDQLFNCVLGTVVIGGEKVWADETLSSRCYRWDVSGRRSWPRYVVDFFARILGDHDHCRESYESERVGRQLPAELRK